MALAACLLGYGEVGLWLKKEAAKPGSWVKLEGNVYLRWIEDYSGEQYQGAVKLGLGECTSERTCLSTMGDDLCGMQKRLRRSRWRTRRMRTASRSGVLCGRSARVSRGGSGTLR